MGLIDGAFGAIGSAITGAVSLAQGIGQNAINRKYQKRQYEYQSKLLEQEQKENRAIAEYQHQKNIELWQMQNEYNSPKNQLQRYTDAGLNPNLLYGNISSGNASTIPSYQETRADYSGLRQVDQRRPDISFLGDILQNLMNFESWRNDQAIKKETARNLAIRTSHEAFKSIITQMNQELKSLEFGIKSDNRYFAKEKFNEWKDLQSQRKELMDYQVNSAMSNAQILSNRAFGISENPHSWAGLLQNAVNSYLRESGAKGGFSTTLGDFVNRFIKSLGGFSWPKFGL